MGITNFIFALFSLFAYIVCIISYTLHLYTLYRVQMRRYILGLNVQLAIAYILSACLISTSIVLEIHKSMAHSDIRIQRFQRFAVVFAVVLTFFTRQLHHVAQLECIYTSDKLQHDFKRHETVSINIKTTYLSFVDISYLN